MARTRRLEIPQRVKLEVFQRAGGPENLHCEGKGCGLPLRNKRFAYDHIVPEGLQPLPREERVIRAEDVQLLGETCCHSPKTKKDVARIAKTKRLEKKAAGAQARRSSFQTNRDGRFKRKMNGEIVER